MNVRVFKTYQRFSDAPYVCGIIPEHGPLACTLDKKDDIVLKCFICHYELRPGIALYKATVLAIEALNIKPENND